MRRESASKRAPGSAFKISIGSHERTSVHESDGAYLAMRKSIKALLLFSIVLTFCVIVLGFRVPNAVKHPGGRQGEADESQFPIADEAAPETHTPAERKKRADKEKKYEKYRDYIGPGVTVAVVSYHWPPGFSTLPVRQSDAVVIGEVGDAKAHLTEDKSTVYSEFKVNVLKVLKDDGQMPSSAGGSITVERPGGRVRYPSGNICRFFLDGLGMPLIMRRYVLFLTRNGEDQSYHLMTGYELRGGRIFPLDGGMTPDGDRFKAYTNMDEAAFFMQLDTALAMSSPIDSK